MVDGRPNPDGNTSDKAEDAPAVPADREPLPESLTSKDSAQRGATRLPKAGQTPSCPGLSVSFPDTSTPASPDSTVVATPAEGKSGNANLSQTKGPSPSRKALEKSTAELEVGGTPRAPVALLPWKVGAPLPPIANPTEPQEPLAPARTGIREPVSEEATVKEPFRCETPEPGVEEASGGVSMPGLSTTSIVPMSVIMVTPELAPVAKVGGLADVVLGLSRELELRGHSVEIILPKYDCLRYDQISGLTHACEHLQVPWYGGSIHTTVWSGLVHGRKCFFIDPHSPDNFFNRRSIYGHNDDAMRFAFLCRAALEFMLKSGKRPEIIHCHDWQTALIPVLLYEIYGPPGMGHPRVCFTIHNFRHQGVIGEQVLRATGLNRPDYFFHHDRLRDNHNPRALNLAKGGIVYSNFITTVSPRHAWEAKDGGQAHGLEPTLHRHHYKFGGVLNGLDYEVFNPETDPHIPSHYNAQSIEKKYDNKRALRQRLHLTDCEKPILAFIGRLDPQKGLDLVGHSLFYALGNRAQFVLLGESPDRAINEHFWGLKRRFPNHPDCHIEIGYNEELSHLIYAGADLMLAPSRFEPCGLTQLISMRYGTVPLVRSVGGLADTVFDKDYANRPPEERNGYVFHQPDNAGIESALQRALGCYYHFPDPFRQLMLNGMRCNHSWSEPGQNYLNIYDFIRDK